MTEMKQMGRLAMRQEGDVWVAYYAQPDTMKEAVWLGSIKMRFVENKERKDLFMLLMREAVGDVIEEIIGERPIWPEAPHPAPQHEKAGRA